VLVAIGLWIRLRLMETPVFEAVRERRAVLKTPIRAAIAQHPKSFLVVLGARMAENGLGYLFPTWGLSYLTLQLGFSKAIALDAVTIATVAELVMVPVWSVLSDRVGRRAVYGGAAAFCVAFAFPFFLLLGTKSTPVVVFAMAVALGIGVAGMFGPQAAFFTELFGPQSRYSGFAFARELGSIISGGPAPTLASLIVLWFAGAPWGVACYIVVLAGITTAAVFWAPETYKVDITAESPYQTSPQRVAVRPIVS
jgi:MHS family shikimate/dehydroshikimate transporter-like MFS transporter